MTSERSAGDGFGRPVSLLLTTGLLTFCSFGAAAETATTLSIGAEYRSGDYGLPGGDIEDLYVPVTVDVQSDNLVFRVTVPYARVEGPEGSLRVSGTVLPGEGRQVKESGIGDVVGSITVQDVARSTDGSVALDLTGTVKLGTADEDKGLGTGEADYSMQADVYRFLDRATVYATLGYKVRGEPSGYDLKDTWFTSAGGAVFLSEVTSVGASFGYRPEVTSGSDAASDLTFFVGQRLTARTELRGHAMLGLSDGSADWGVGMTMKLRL